MQWFDRTQSVLGGISERWDSVGPGRFDFYQYLGAVYDYYVALERNHIAKRTLKYFAENDPSKFQENDLIRHIIDRTCDADRKTKSRCARALRFAWSRRCDGLQLERFLKKHGGPAGCALRWTKANPVRQRSPYYKGPSFHMPAGKVPALLLLRARSKGSAPKRLSPRIAPAILGVYGQR